MDRAFFLKPALRLADTIFSCLAPPRCRACGAPLFDHDNPYLCAACAGNMRWIGDGACRSCGFPAGPYATLGRDCRRCRGRRLGLTATAAVARYRGAARNLVMALKYGGDTELALPLAGMMADRLRGMDFCSRVEVAIPVALHEPRQRRRGFDQAELLGGLVARRLGIESRRGLRRTRATRPQASLGRVERLRNMTGVFVADPGAVAGKRILLVDDVLTTGATLADCARACREAGATNVYALVFAR